MSSESNAISKTFKSLLHDLRQRLRGLDPRPSSAVVNILSQDADGLTPKINEVADQNGHCEQVIDLGRNYPIMKLTLRHKGRIAVSSDGHHWSDVPFILGRSRYFSPRDLRARYLTVRNSEKIYSQNSIGIYVRRFDLLLARICKEYGIDYDKASGYGIPKNKWEILRIIADRGASIRDTPVSGVLIRRGGRLGNNMLQLINAIYFCERTGVSKVHLFEQSLLRIDHPITINGIEFLSKSNRVPHKDIVIDGRFFHMHGMENIYAGFSEADAFRISREYLRKLFAQSLFSPTGEISPDDLVIHIRAGDVFTPKGKPAPANYLQPPLAFYLEALAHYRSNNPMGKVHVVYEDRGNPCVDALERHLVSSGIDHAMLSGTLERDFNLLINARNLTVGYGTFGQLAVYLSDRTRSLYTFRQPLIGNAAQALMGIRNYVLADTDNAYLQQGAWANTPEQRECMLTFPRSQLKFIPQV